MSSRGVSLVRAGVLSPGSFTCSRGHSESRGVSLVRAGNPSPEEQILRGRSLDAGYFGGHSESMLKLNTESMLKFNVKDTGPQRYKPFP